MITFIILLAILLLSIYLLKHSDYEITGFSLCLITSVLLFFHLIAWSLASISYNSVIVQRNAFIATLNEARKNNNPYETAAIVQNIAAWNISLAEDKYWNSTWIGDPYIDDRIETLEPIK